MISLIVTHIVHWGECSAVLGGLSSTFTKSEKHTYGAGYVIKNAKIHYFTSFALWSNSFLRS